jgi:serine/threonine protein kinase
MIGEIVSHYKILEELGSGGMAVVYKAEDTRLKRTVALKFLSPDCSVNTEENPRFIREAQASAALDHPNICAVYEIDEAKDRLFISMAYIEGKTLEEKIRTALPGLDEILEVALGERMMLATDEGARCRKRWSC